MHYLFWFLFFAMPLLAVAFVARVVLGVWRRGKRAFGEVGALTDRVDEVRDSIESGPASRSYPGKRA